MIAGNLWLKGETIPSLDIATLDSLDFSQMKTFERCIFVSGAKASDIMFGDTDFHLENVAEIIGL